MVVKPLAYGSFENDVILRQLVEAGATLTLQDVEGNTPVELARSQGSGVMLRCLRDAMPSAVGVDFTDSAVEQSTNYPDNVDVDADAKGLLMEVDTHKPPFYTNRHHRCGCRLTLRLRVPLNHRLRHH